MRLEVLEGDSGGWSGPSEEEGQEVSHNGQLQWCSLGEHPCLAIWELGMAGGGLVGSWWG